MLNHMVPKHKVFISFHHDDEYYRKKFEGDFTNEMNPIFVNRSVQDGDIDPTFKTDTIRQKIRDDYISDSTVTIILIGPDTWRRKHVDWEIGYSLTNTNQNNRSGLIGILLPNYRPHLYCDTQHTENGCIYTPCNIPPRLNDNIVTGYAKIYSYPTSRLDSGIQLKQWIHEAFQRRNSFNPNKRRQYYNNNRTQSSHWE